jgi:hypothetical protein
MVTIRGQKLGLWGQTGSELAIPMCFNQQASSQSSKYAGIKVQQTLDLMDIDCTNFGFNEQSFAAFFFFCL